MIVTPSQVANRAPATWWPLAACPQPGSTSERHAAAPGLMNLEPSATVERVGAGACVVSRTWADRRTGGQAGNVAASNTQNQTTTARPPDRLTALFKAPPARSVALVPRGHNTKRLPGREARRPGAGAAGPPLRAAPARGSEIA